MAEPVPNPVAWRAVRDPHHHWYRWRCRALVIEGAYSTIDDWQTREQASGGGFVPLWVSTPEREALWKALFLHP